MPPGDERIGISPGPAWATIAAAAALTIGVTASMCSGRLVVGVPQQWTWDLRPTHRFWALPVTAFAFVVFLLSAAAVAFKLREGGDIERLGRRLDAVLLLVLTALGMGLQFGVGQLSKAGLRDWALVTALPHTNGYFDEARRVRSVRALLREYPRRMPRLNFHCRTHPPGALLYFLAAQRVFESSPGLTAAVDRLLAGGVFDTRSLFDEAGLRLTPAERAAAWASAMGLAFAAVLACIPIYVLSARYFGRRGGWWAGAAWLASPCALYFTPAVDQALAALCALGGCLWLLALDDLRRGRRGSPLLCFFAGLVMALALFVSISAGVCAVLLAMVWAMALRVGPRGPLLAAAGWAAAGAALFFGLLWLVGDYDAVAVFGRILSVARENVRQGYIGRAVQFAYAKWLVWNLVEFGVGLGWATAACAAAWGWRRGFRSPLLGAWAATLVLLDASGASMSETGRLWMFLMWPPVVAAGGFLARVRRGGEAVGALFLILLFAQAAALKLCFGWV